MAALIVALLVLPAQALRLDGGAQAAAWQSAQAVNFEEEAQARLEADAQFDYSGLPDVGVNLEAEDDAFQSQAWGDEDSDPTMAAADLVSWTSIVNRANVPPEFKASLSVSEDDGWTMTFPAWYNRTGPADYSGCPPIPGKDTAKDVCYAALSESGELCFSGRGFLPRAASTFVMFQEAAGLLRARGYLLRPFGRKAISIGDNAAPCGTDVGYASKTRKSSCNMRLIPDFTFGKFPETGFLPNFTVLSKVVERYNNRRPEDAMCLWVGNPNTHNVVLPRFEEAVRHDLSYAVVRAKNRRMTLEQQAKWTCLVDVPNQGYSARVPLLLHTGRPVIMIERVSGANPESAEPTGYFVDNTWYAQFMQPWVHYIPLYANFSNLKNVTRVALGKEGKAIGNNAIKMARKKLTTEAAVEAMAGALLSMQGDGPAPTRAPTVYLSESAAM